MRRVAVATAVFTLMLMTGCRYLDPILNPPDNPDPEPSKPPAENILPSVKVFESEVGWNIPGILWHDEYGLIVLTYKSDRRPMTSRVYLQAQKGRAAPDFTNGAETIGQPFTVDGTVYFPQEHVDRCLFLDGMFGYARPSPGRWSVTGFEYKGRPALAFNNSYNGAMRDNPVIVDPVSGEQYFTISAKMMPRSMVEWDGLWWVSGDTGEMGTWTAERKYEGNVIHMAVMNGYLYGGAKDGAIWRMGRDGWTDKIVTESSVSMAMVSTGDTIYYTGGRPNRLYKLTRDSLTLIAKDDTPDSGGNYFGNAVAFNDTHVFWAYWNAQGKRGIIVRIAR